MPSWQCNPSALNIPDVGIVVVGGAYGETHASKKSAEAELLVQDPADASDWRWLELKPMPQARRSPEIAYFKGCVVVVGGDEGLTVECLPLSSVEQTGSQWTQLHGFFEQHISSISLVTFNDRLIFLLKFFIQTPCKGALLSELTQTCECLFLQYFPLTGPMYIKFYPLER